MLRSSKKRPIWQLASADLLLPAAKNIPEGCCSFDFFPKSNNLMALGIEQCSRSIRETLPFVCNLHYMLTAIGENIIFFPQSLDFIHVPVQRWENAGPLIQLLRCRCRASHQRSQRDGSSLGARAETLNCEPRGHVAHGKCSHSLRTI